MTEKIGYNPYFYSYPQYLSNNLGVSNTNRITPNFRGDGVEIASPQTSVNYTTTPDTVEISAGNKINEASTQEKQKNGISTLAKVGIAIGGTALAGILAHKFIPPMRVQSRVQRIFLEDFTKEEAKAIQKKYQDILKISDKDEFIDKLFAELKKDLGLEAMPIKLNSNYKIGESKCGAITAKSIYTRDYGNINTVSIDKRLPKEELLKTLTHEMRHAKQDLLNYQVANEVELKNMLKQRFIEMFKNDPTHKMQDIDKDVVDTYNQMQKYFSSFGVKKIDNSDKNYIWGRKILESMSIDGNKSAQVYRNIFYETDAKSTERLMDRMVHNRLF